MFQLAFAFSQTLLPLYSAYSILWRFICFRPLQVLSSVLLFGGYHLSSSNMGLACTGKLSSHQLQIYLCLVLMSRLRFALVKPDKGLMQREDPWIRRLPAHSRSVITFAAAIAAVTFVSRGAYGQMQLLALERMGLPGQFTQLSVPWCAGLWLWTSFSAATACTQLHSPGPSGFTQKSLPSLGKGWEAQGPGLISTCIRHSTHTSLLQKAKDYGTSKLTSMQKRSQSSTNPFFSLCAPLPC